MAVISNIRVNRVMHFCYALGSQLSTNDQSIATVFSLLKLKTVGQMTASQKCEESYASTTILDDRKTNSM